jgi:asparagine synthase (glutamine-hydrolysing)
MCGIAGSINLPLNSDIVFKTLLHRGPDAQTSYKRDLIELYHLRLSILDIKGGAQPMALNDRYYIVFNGEIYNHSELRIRYNLKGISNSDTETLLLLYARFGPAMLDFLDGMFAFAIVDFIEKKVFIARDRAGKKPLYFFHSHNCFAFSSELNCLNKSIQLSINNEAINQYIRFGSCYKKNTPYNNVEELDGGSFLLIDYETFNIKKEKWWRIEDYYHQYNHESYDSIKEKTIYFLRESVKRRINSSDLEVGCFLSGGIDSGLITALASDIKPNLKTFTVAFDGEYDESQLAKLVSDKYSTNHHEIKISFDSLENDIEKIISFYGEPFADSSAIPSYYLCKEAKKHLTVILNGDGADELFAGYRRYVPFKEYDFFKNSFLIKNLSSVIYSTLPFPNDKKSIYNYLYRLFALSSFTGLKTYLSAGVDFIEGYENSILSKDNYLLQPSIDIELITNTSNSSLKKIMNLDFNINLFSDLLVKMDIATMSNSLEGRSPFLCKELLEYAPSIPDDYKIKNRTTKYLLRDIAKNYLPKELIFQPKRGFEVPLKNWIDGQLKSIIGDYINGSDTYYSHFIDKNFIKNLFDNKLKIPSEKRAKILWNTFCLEVWYQKCVKLD